MINYYFRILTFLNWYWSPGKRSRIHYRFVEVPKITRLYVDPVPAVNTFLVAGAYAETAESISTIEVFNWTMTLASFEGKY